MMISDSGLLFGGGGHPVHSTKWFESQFYFVKNEFFAFFV